MVEREEVLQIEAGIDRLCLLTVEVPIGREVEPLQQGQQVLQRDFLCRFAGAGEADLDEGPPIVRVLGQIVCAGEFRQSTRLVAFRELPLPLVREVNPGRL